MLIQRSPFILPDTASEPVFRQILTLSRAVSFFSFPLVVREQVIGFMNFSSQTPRTLPESEQKIFCTVANRIAAAVENARLHAEVQQLAITDALTNLYNRRGLFKLGRYEVERAQRFERSLAIVMFDLDHFKQINDTYGHAVGDQVLVQVTAHCKSMLRGIDLFGRYGGEEFVVLLPETDFAGAMDVAERLRRCTEQEVIAADHAQIRITISLGFAILDKDCTTLETLLEHADQRLLNAKQTGRNRVAGAG